MTDEPTCGNSSAAHAVLPAPVGGVIRRMAALEAYCLVAWLLISIGFTAEAVAQAPDGISPSGLAVIGQVTDTTGAPLAGAEVLVILDSGGTVVDSGTSNARGEVSLWASAPGGSYSVLARKVGYTPRRRSGIVSRGSDTVTLRFMLQPLTPSLDEVVSRGYYDCDALFNPCDARQGRPPESLPLQEPAPDRQSAKLKKVRAVEVSKRVRKTARRVERTGRAGLRADPNDALLIRDVASGCADDMPPDDDLFVLCREILKRTPRATLDRLVQVLAVMDTSGVRRESRGDRP